MRSGETAPPLGGAVLFQELKAGGAPGADVRGGALAGRAVGSRYRAAGRVLKVLLVEIPERLRTQDQLFGCLLVHCCLLWGRTALRISVEWCTSSFSKVKEHGAPGDRNRDRPARLNAPD